MSSVSSGCPSGGASRWRSERGQRYPERVGARPALAGTALAVAVAVGLTPAVAPPPPRGQRRPDRGRQAAADAVAARIGDLDDQLAAAQAAVDAAHAPLGDRARRVPGHGGGLPGRAARADVAAAAAAGGRRARCRAGEIVAFARRSYMQGSTYAGAAALITAADPAADRARRAARGGRRHTAPTSSTGHGRSRKRPPAADAVARTAVAEATS